MDCVLSFIYMNFRKLRHAPITAHNVPFTASPGTAAVPRSKPVPSDASRDTTQPKSDTIPFPNILFFCRVVHEILLKRYQLHNVSDRRLETTGFSYFSIL